MSIEDMKYMSAGQQMKRFVHYLNHAFYADADTFLKEKHSAFLRKMHPQKKSQGSVFERLAGAIKSIEEEEEKNDIEGKNSLQLSLKKMIL